MKKSALVLFLAGCGVAEVATTATAPQALELEGPLNDAFRGAEQQTGVPRELLMAIAYQQGRFERAEPPIERPRVVSADPEEQGNEDVMLHRVGVMYLTPEAASGLKPSDDAANVLAAARLLKTTGAIDWTTLGAYEQPLRAFQDLQDAPAAAQLALDDIRKILRRGFDVTTSSGERLAMRGFGPPEAVQAKQGIGEYPPMQWIPAAASNQGSRGGSPIRFVVVHDMEGFMGGALSVFQNPARQASAHYLTRASDGHIVQMVSEANNAWHCGNGFYNRNSIGIEHEGFAGRPQGGGFYNETQYAASARLVCAIATRYGIPIDRGHIFGHGNVPISGSGALCSDADANAARCGGFSQHWDPGPEWNWGHYLDLIARSCGAGGNGGGGSAAGDSGFGRIGRNPDGRLEVFARGGDNAIWHQWQQPGGGWSGWWSLGGEAANEPVVGVNRDGRLEVFVVGTDRAVWHNWQDGHGGWSGWWPLGGVAQSELAVGNDEDGRIELFVRGDDEALWHQWQDGSGGWSPWSRLGGAFTDAPAVTRDAGGRLVVFVRGTDGAVYSIAQVAPNAGWGGWEGHGGVIHGGPAVGMNADGRLEIFVRGSDDALWHRWQEGGGGWSGWSSRGGGIAERPAIGRNGDGRLEAFVKGNDGALWHIWQKEPNGGWGDFVSLGGGLTSAPHVASNADGRLEVFVRGGDGAVHHNWQTAPNAHFSGFSSLGGYVTAL